MFKFVSEDDGSCFRVKGVLDFNHQAITLDPEKVLENHSNETGVFQRLHSDGWTIKGEIREDYYFWVNEFEASHPVYGRVWGNFEETVYADSEEGFVAFTDAHEPYVWDYYDI